MSIINNWLNDYYDLYLNMKFELLKNQKQKRILIVGVISIVLPLLFYIVPILANTPLPETVDEFLPDIMTFTYLIVVLNAIFFGADSLNSETYSKTALLLYPLPMRRTIIFLAKYLTQLLTSWFMISLYYATSAVIIAGVYGTDQFSIAWIKSLLFAFLYMAALLSIAFFLSSIVRNPAASMMFTFFLIFMLLPITSMLLNRIDVDSSYIVTNYSSFITKIFRFPSSSFGPSLESENTTIERGISLCLLYSFVLTIGAWWYNNKQEV